MIRVDLGSQSSSASTVVQEVERRPRGILRVCFESVKRTEVVCEVRQSVSGSRGGLH